MNIFVLDLAPRQAARYHCDKHVVKMILESAQLLSTAHHRAGSDTAGMYRPTHVNHPCAVWVRERACRYRWLYALFCGLADEYTERYGKVHLSYRKLRRPLMALPANLRDCAHEQFYDVDCFALCMPRQYKNPESSVQSYRAYYMGEKRTIARWEYCNAPEWWQ